MMDRFVAWGRRTWPGWLRRAWDACLDAGTELLPSAVFLALVALVIWMLLRVVAR